MPGKTFKVSVLFCIYDRANRMITFYPEFQSLGKESCYSANATSRFDMNTTVDWWVQENVHIMDMLDDYMLDVKTGSAGSTACFPSRTGGLWFNLRRNKGTLVWQSRYYCWSFPPLSETNHNPLHCLLVSFFPHQIGSFFMSFPQFRKLIMLFRLNEFNAEWKQFI